MTGYHHWPVLTYFGTGPARKCSTVEPYVSEKHATVLKHRYRNVQGKKILLYLNVGIPEKKKILEESDSTVGIECAFKLLKRENLIFSSVLGWNATWAVDLYKLKVACLYKSLTNTTLLMGSFIQLCLWLSTMTAWQRDVLWNVTSVVSTTTKFLLFSRQPTSPAYYWW